MKITPLEIRQKTFEKNFRGYEKDEVHAFLFTLSQEWERMMDENKELRIKLETTEREVSKLREVESSLYKTLKTAEDTGASVIDQARKAAELHLRESQMNADAMMNEAKTRAKNTIEEAEMRSKEVLADMEDRLKNLIDNYKKLETSREDLVNDLRRMGNDIMDRVERFKITSKDFDADKHLNVVRREAKKIIFPNMEVDRTLKPEPKPQLKEEPVLEPQVFEPQAPAKKAPKSFFDDVQ
jgi:cell division initiation protein